MKRELALQLLQTILPGVEDEDQMSVLFRDLQFLADYKYNNYEMYSPGRLFLENLYLWLQNFEEDDKYEALKFIKNRLIFISREEIHQLAQVLYQDIIRRKQLEAAARIKNIPSYMLRRLRDSDEFKRASRQSLFVGMSDGARIDYIRRQNLDIKNEQVLTHYSVSQSKCQEILRDLISDLRDSTALFNCLFLIDDFCGSGKTLLREYVTTSFDDKTGQINIPANWRSRLNYNEEENILALYYQGELTNLDYQTLLKMGTGPDYTQAIKTLLIKTQEKKTELRGTLTKVASEGLSTILAPDAEIYYCPLITSQYAKDRLEPLFLRLNNQFSNTQMCPVTIIDSEFVINSPNSPVGKLCDDYYSTELEDEHTGSVKYGIEDCGLPLVLHHNTPNNSIYLLWARKKKGFKPLFVRYERHGREGI